MSEPIGPLVRVANPLATNASTHRPGRAVAAVSASAEAKQATHTKKVKTMSVIANRLCAA